MPVTRLGGPLAPDDVLIRVRPSGNTQHFIVADPAFTARGKLRLWRYPQGTLVAAWWSHAWLPPFHTIHRKAR